MGSYDKRMEESDEKLKARLEDFEAERRDAELAFKVIVVKNGQKVAIFFDNPKTEPNLILYISKICRLMWNAD